MSYYTLFGLLTTKGKQDTRENDEQLDYLIKIPESQIEMLMMYWRFLSFTCSEQIIFVGDKEINRDHWDMYLIA